MTRRSTETPREKAVGLLTKALETTERARGHLYSFHQLTGTADFQLDDAIEALRAAGEDEFADELQADLVGRNVIADRWTYQIVEDYDATYWSVFRAWEARAREQLAEGRLHVHEAVLKEQRRTHGRPHHEAGPEHPAERP